MVACICLGGFAVCFAARPYGNWYGYGNVGDVVADQRGVGDDVWWLVGVGNAIDGFNDGAVDEELAMLIVMAVVLSIAAVMQIMMMIMVYASTKFWVNWQEYGWQHHFYLNLFCVYIA